MKKQYYTPSFEVVTIQNCTPLCTSQITVGDDSQQGSVQFSNEYEDGIIDDESAEF